MGALLVFVTYLLTLKRKSQPEQPTAARDGRYRRSDGRGAVAPYPSR